MAQQQTESQETLVAWLNDAYAMENSLIHTLEGHAKDAAAMPQLQARMSSTSRRPAAMRNSSKVVSSGWVAIHPPSRPGWRR